MEPSLQIIAIAVGLLIGGTVGATVLLTNFCALGGIADIMFAKDARRMRAWVLAAGVAVVGTHALDSAGLIRLDLSQPLAPYILWLPALLGGVMFGFGMALAGGCISRALTRIGAGSFKSVVIVAVIALTAGLASHGLLAPLKAMLTQTGLLETFGPGGLHRIFANIPYGHPEAIRWAFVALIGGGLLWSALKDPWFRASRDHLIGGLVIGLAIVAAWLAAGLLADTTRTLSFTALNFVPPLADLVLLSRGDTLAWFAFATVAGVPLGALIAGALTGNLAFERLGDRAETGRNVIGAALMGVGGTWAVGGTFGQGLSGLSALAPTAILAIAGIVAGTIWGIRTFEAGSVWGGLKLALKRH